MKRSIVNVAAFNEMFDAASANKEFDMRNPCDCFYGSFARDRGFTPEIRAEIAIKLQISEECLCDWYCVGEYDGDGFRVRSESWPPLVDFEDVYACINNVKRIVEKHHGPQNWNGDRPTLTEFLAGLSPKKEPAPTL